MGSDKEEVADHSSSSSPKFTPYHPLIPKLYISAWKQDMKNRDLIVENCNLAGLPYQAEDSLYLEKVGIFCFVTLNFKV